MSESSTAPSDEQPQSAAPLEAPPSPQELLALIAALSERVETLEAELSSVREELPPPPIPDEVVLAISAAVAAFLGHRAKLKQIRFSPRPEWARQGRAAVQRRNVMHGVR